MFVRTKARLSNRLRARQTVGLAINVSDFPETVAVLSDPCDPAGIEMERAVVVQIGSSQAANDAENRKVMTYHNHRLTGLMTLRDACQSAPGSLGHIGEPFSAWYLDFRRGGSPTG